MSRIEQLISEIETYIDSCKPQAFSNNKKIVVDKDEIEDLLVELRHRTPDEIKKYQKIVSNRDAILEDARAQSEAMMAEARKQTNDLINEHEIMQRAYVQANDIVEKANAKAQSIVNSAAADAENIREGAIRYTDGILKSLQTIISHAMQSADSKHEALMQSLQSNYDIVTGNRNELSGVSEEVNEEIAAAEDEE